MRTGLIGFRGALVALSLVGRLSVANGQEAPNAQPGPPAPKLYYFSIKAAYSLDSEMVKYLQGDQGTQAVPSAGQRAIAAAPATTGTVPPAPGKAAAPATAAAGSAQPPQPGALAESQAAGAAASGEKSLAQTANSAAAAQKASPIPWSPTVTGIAPLAVPVDLRLVGKNVLAIMQIIPLSIGPLGVDILVQGQVMARQTDDTVSLNAFSKIVQLALGSRFYLYPLGLKQDTGAPIVVEIRVDDRDTR